MGSVAVRGRMLERRASERATEARLVHLRPELRVGRWWQKCRRPLVGVGRSGSCQWLRWGWAAPLWCSKLCNRRCQHSTSRQSSASIRTDLASILYPQSTGALNKLERGFFSSALCLTTCHRLHKALPGVPGRLADSTRCIPGQAEGGGRLNDVSPGMVRLAPSCERHDMSLASPDESAILSCAVLTGRSAASIQAPQHDGAADVGSSCNVCGLSVSRACYKQTRLWCQVKVIREGNMEVSQEPSGHVRLIFAQ